MSDARIATVSPPIAVVHFAREINRHTGAAAVVAHLDEELRRHGVASRVQTSRWAHWLQRNRAESRVLRKLSLALELVLYAVESLRFRTPVNTISISHSDALRGDVQVFHSCHKALVRQQLKEGRFRALLDPVTWIVLARQWLRDRWFPPRYIVAVSEETLREVRNEHSRLRDIPGTAIPNGVDVARFQDANRNRAWRTDVRTRLAIPGSAFVLLFVANRFPVKGLDVAVRAIARLPDRVHLVIVGGDTRTPYDRLAVTLGVSERIHFVGRATHPEPYFAAADAFVLPTRYEPFGLVGIEALAAGLPILMPRTGGIPTYLEHGMNGWFIADESDVIEYTTQLMNDRGLYERMRARAFASSHSHSWTTRVEEYVRVFASIASTRQVDARVAARDVATDSTADVRKSRTASPAVHR